MSYQLVSPGIYKDSRTGNFYERPIVRGRRTWRRLDGHSLKLAKESFAQRRADTTRAKLGLVRDPYRPKAGSVGDIIESYKAAGCPGRDGAPRTGKQLDHEHYRIAKLLPFWRSHDPEQVSAEPDCRAYFAARQRTKVRVNAHCGRAVDMELQTLASALAHAVRAGRLHANPLAVRPHFRAKTIKHCRDTMPANAEELHALAVYLFEKSHRVPLGWQLLLEAFTGCRTSEVLALRWDAAPRQPGYIDGDYLWLSRAKGGTNPFALIHPALRTCLDELKAWHATKPNAGPWFVPSARRPGAPVETTSLTHRLAKVGPIICQRHITSHGLRAYYVTVRRSQGISDGQIAAEIGDASGAAIIASTYGAIPPNWRGGEGIGWLPVKNPPAWECLKRRFEKASDQKSEGSHCEAA